MNSTFDNYDIRSESTPKSIIKRQSANSPKKVNFSPTKEVKNFKDYFDSSDESIRSNRVNDSQNKYDEILHEPLINRIITDSNIPYVLSLYLQLIFNIIIIGLICYFIIIFIQTIKSDINNKLQLYISDTLQEISKCSRHYYRNKCDEAKVPPILEDKCTNWMKCMNRDPQLIGKSKITAEIFADIINGFIKPISWKSIFFLITLIIGSLLTTNVVFNSYRNPHNIEIDKLQMIIKHQNVLIEDLKTLKTSRPSLDYLDDLDNELSISSPLNKKSR
ncbi:putative nucleus export protein Brr6p [[Candida] jaroonii]|uniref:Nucleus export protein Brr6p n=1 Tax=[Candida] jaroonii TaxID=467808 RepID=A0ACA9YFJ7_9ASCO|nr:putative nucleus export protein Brr6p [[Candida] jaroonii]